MARQITFAGQTFGLEEKAPGGLILKISEAEQAGDDTKVMALTLRMLRLLCAEEDRDRFEEFIASPEFDGLDFDDIRSAIEQVAVASANRPTRRSASSPSGSRATPATSKVVRLSPATNPASSNAGTSQAS